MFLRKTLAPVAAGIILVAGALALALAAPAAAQEVVQDEGAAYRAWYEATHAKDAPKAVEAGRAYLEKYPTGQYADAIKKWLLPNEYDLAIKEKRTGDAIKLGRALLSADPENLRLLYQLAFTVRANELTATPPNYDHVADAVEFSKKAISQIEAGKVLEGAASFNKNAALSWLTQVLAINEAKNGTPEEAIKLYEKSTSLGLDSPQVAGRNLLAVNSIRLAAYAEAVNALKAFSDADKAAPEPNPEVKAALDRLRQASDALIESAASFVAYAKVKNVAAKSREQLLNETLTPVYKSRFPEDTTLTGLQKILSEKEAALGGSTPPSN